VRDNTCTFTAYISAEPDFLHFFCLSKCQKQSFFSTKKASTATATETPPLPLILPFLFTLYVRDNTRAFTAYISAENTQFSMLFLSFQVPKMVILTFIE
jgi:hypothetical protein